MLLGVNGDFGRLFARHLAAAGVAVHGVDLAPEAAAGVACERYLGGDVTRPGRELLAWVEGAGCLLICLPEEPAWTVLERLVPRLAPGALSADILSVKGPVAARLAGRPAAGAPPGEAPGESPGESPGDYRGEHLSLHPLFAPELGFAGHNVAAVPLVPGPRGEALLRLVGSWGARVTAMDAGEHDRLTARTQAAPHAALLAFGLSLLAGGGDPARLLAVATPPFLELLALFARIVSRDPGVYWSIQADHPAAAEARCALAEALGEVDRLAAEGDREAWARRLAAAAAALGEERERLQAVAAGSLAAAVGEWSRGGGGEGGSEPAPDPTPPPPRPRR